MTASDAAKRGGSLVVRGGRVVTADGILDACDVAIRDGVVEAVSPNLPVRDGVDEIDARGKLVLPASIDPQVHFREPGLEHKEDLASGSRAAVAGGVATFFEMPNTNPSTTDPDALEDKFRRASGRAFADHAFFLGATAENAEQLGEWESLPGCAGVKLFMGSSTGGLLVEDDETIERLLRAGSRRVTVHSEDEYRLRERYAAIDRDHAHVRQHPEVRDVESAVRSTTRLLNLAEKTGRRVHVLHISTAEEVAMLRDRALGDLVTAEATPNHLFLHAPDCYEEHGTWAQMNPPVREKRHQEAIWQGLHDGVLTCIGSDHAPHRPDEKERPWPGSPSGIAGVQTTLPLLLTGVRDGRLRLEDIVRFCVLGPLRVYAAEHKGALVPGCDGDVTIVDPDDDREITLDMLESRAGGSPFVGRRLAGWPVTTIVRGCVVWNDGRPVGEASGRRVTFAR
jgi:dihydroorotase